MGSRLSANALDCELYALSDDGSRQVFFDLNPSLLVADTVERLCGRSLEQLRVDLAQAAIVAETASWVANHLQDERCLGRSARALANVRLFQRDHSAALDFSEAALGHFEKAGDTKEAAITRSSSVQSMISLGQYDRALEWIERARSVFRDEHDELRLARLELNAGAVHARQDRQEDALVSFRAALEVFRRLGNPNDVGICLRNIAVCLQDLHDLRAAEDAYGEARDYLEAHDLPLLLLEVEYNIAYLYYLRGEYVRAIKHFEMGRAKSERLQDRHHQALADLDQSEVFLELNLLEEAAGLSERACGRFGELEMKYEQAKALTNCAIAASRQGKKGDSLDLLQEARKAFAEEGNRVWLAILDLYRAIVLFSEGRFFESAQYAGDALEGFGDSSLPSKTAMCEIVLGRLSLEEDDPSEALARCASALGRLEPLGLPALEHQALVVQGRALELKGDPDSALEAYEQAQARLEGFDYHWQTDEFRMAFLEDKLLVHESLVALELDGEPGRENLEAAFSHIERSKSRSISDLMAFRAHAIPPRSQQPETVAHMRRLREELKGYYGQMNQAEREGARSSKRAAELKAKAEQDQEKLTRTLQSLQTTDREFGSLQTATTVGLSEIQSKLPENTALLEYFFARGVIYGCVVRSDDLQITPIAAQSHVRELHRALQFQFSKFLLSAGYVEQFEDFVGHATNTYLRAVYEELVAPFTDLLDCEHLIIVPHEFLHHLPFHALFDGEQHLMDRYSISYAPSAGVHYFSTTKEPLEGEGALVMGVGGDLAPWIFDEAKSVAEALGDSKLLIGEEATLAALEASGAGSRIVHVASHGSFRADNPMFSTIQLGDQEISLFDLYELDLQAELVVLTGCGTGLGLAPTADEHVALVRGLLYAGARSLVTTLWDTNDESRMIFMRDFYRHLGETSQPAESLRRAAQDLRDLYDHPYFWAPFVLSGRPDLG